MEVITAIIGALIAILVLTVILLALGAIAIKLFNVLREQIKNGKNIR